MNGSNLSGWQSLVDGFPWFQGKGSFPIPAYSEFMPAPRLGKSLYGEIDTTTFLKEDPFGWHISELEQVLELEPGLENITRQVLGHFVKLGRGETGHQIGGHRGRNLAGNPYWPPELASCAPQLKHERFVTLLPIALARTQDDMGRVRWTLFGSSEQGPERAFWKSFYRAPGEEMPTKEAIGFLSRLLSGAYGESVDDIDGLLQRGFRILPSASDSQMGVHWGTDALPSWTKRLIINDGSALTSVRYLLTFRPFQDLPREIQQAYMDERLYLLPFPGSLAFWGIPTYLQLQQHMAFVPHLPLLRLVARHGGPDGIRVPQSGWLHEPRQDKAQAEVESELVLNTYRRTNRWNRVHRYQDDVALSVHTDRMSQVLFSTALESLGLYDKPMARNCQLWSEEGELVLDGPSATSRDIERAAERVLQGGLFRYRFLFPAMRVGLHQVYWHRPLIAYLAHRNGQVETFFDAPLGYMTAYRAGAPDLKQPVELWPRLDRRDAYLTALHDFHSPHDYFAHQTALNIVALLDAQLKCGEPLPRSLARQIMEAAQETSLDEWLASLPERADNPEAGRKMQRALHPLIRAADPPLPDPITFHITATRTFEEAYWEDISVLAHGKYINKDNADVVDDPTTQQLVAHHHRDLERLGDYLIERHQKSIQQEGMEGKAVVGDMPFRWETDFDFPVFGGWRINQEGHPRERNIMVVIPGRRRDEAVVLADHYDTAYMEDIYDKARGGSGARLSAAGADDNHSATAALLQAAPVFLKLAHEGKLERDVWLLHLTGEEFPSDCMGARNFCQALVEKTLTLRVDKEELDLSKTRVVGVHVMDMIAHNRDNGRDIFQISPGRSNASFDLAHQAHLANAIWNAHTREWNTGPERKGRGRGERSKDGKTIPSIAMHPDLYGEVRTPNNPQSSLYNTDGQIFSDIGAPVVLFMENYDINRTGYHDTHDTLENIDLDYGSALAAIAIETVARVATNP